MNIKRTAQRILPEPTQQWLRRRSQAIKRFLSPNRGSELMTSLMPHSRQYGYDRGRPIDRYYIESFLAKHSEDIAGHVLEVENNHYTVRYGGDKVTKGDILHVSESCLKATIVADLTDADHIESNQFDCIILTQVLQYIYNPFAAMGTLHRILKPAGVLLCTVPGIAQLHQEPADTYKDYWRFTQFSLRRLCEEHFKPANISVQSSGNVYAASTFLYGLAVEDIKTSDLDYNDSRYEVNIAVRAVK